jgi:AhpC/TSA family
MKRSAVRRLLGVGLLAAATMSPVLSSQLSAQARKPEPAPMKLKVGDMAPDFKLQYFDGTDEKDVSLSQYRGKKNVVLAFYIFAFTGG